jgi:peroxiredoxin
MSKSFARGLLILIVASCIGCSSGGIEAGYDAPDFKLTDLGGKAVSLKEHRGSIVVADFWATWCPPCLMSISELVEVQEKYRDRGVVILGISVDMPENVSEADLRAFKDRLKMNYTVLRADDQVMVDYFGGKGEQVAIPSLFIIDKEGKIREKLVGFKPGQLEKSLQKLLS